ncbi:MAG TPA: M56 family metallopeptidase [Gemmataceae bacterium]|nr:M56 family metallopeptidase [Gemmataceae bacterium]
MSMLLTFGLANAVSAALLAVMALIAGRYCRRSAVLHSLWLLVLLKLVTPPLWPITVANLPEESAAPAETAPQPVELLIPQHPAANTAGYIIGEPVALAARGEARTPMTANPVDRALGSLAPIPVHNSDYFLTPSIVTVRPATMHQPPELDSCVLLLGLAWLAGIGVWLLWAASRIGRFQRLLRYARPAGGDIQEQTRCLAARMGLRRSPEVLLLPGALPPLVWAALGRVRIFLPAKLITRLNETERASLLAHELAHVRRRDHWVRWLELIASALYWWYPLVWLARRRLHRYEEECCDAWVVGELPARVYAGAIMNTLDFLAEDRTPLPVMASGLATVELLKRRLNLIMDGGAPKRLSFAGKLALVLAGLLLLALRPNLAHTEAKPPEETESKEQPAAKADPDKDTATEEPTAFDPQAKLLQDAKLESAPLALACSPDSKMLALALADQTTQLRDAASGELRFTLKAHEDAVTCVAFSPDGKTLASGSPDRTVRLWDAASGKLGRVLQGHNNWIYAVAFSPDGKTLASSGYDKTIRLWDPSTGTARRILKGHKASVRTLAFSPDGKTLASAGSDRTIRLWTMNGDAEPDVLKGHEDTIRVVAFSPDGKTLASGSEDQAVKLWDTAKKSERTTLKGHTTEVTALTFSPRGKILVSGAAGGGIVIWDVASGAKHSQLQGHSDAITGLIFAGSNKLLSASNDSTVKIWLPSASPVRLLRGHTGPVVSLVISGDGRRLLSGSGWPQGDKTARLWDLKTGKELRVYRAETPPVGKGPREQPNEIQAVALSPDGKQAVSAGVGGVVFLWDVESGKEVRRFQGHVGAIYALDFAPDGRHMLSGGRDKTVRLWEVQSGREIRKFEGHTDWVRCVRFARDGKRFLSSGRDGVMRLWDVDSGKLISQFQAAQGWMDCVVWSPDQRQAICAAGNVVQLWDLEKNKLTRSLQGHQGNVICVDVSPDGRRILSGSYDGTVRCWDANTGKQQKLYRQSGYVWTVKFTPDGRQAVSGGGGKPEDGDTYVSGGNDFPIRVWSLSDEQTARTGKEDAKQK